jgi:hypothetical protein
MKNTMKLLCLAFFITAVCFAGDDHDHDHDAPKPGRPTIGKQAGPGEEGCNASPARLADFANGDKFDFNSVVTFITSPACAVVHQQVSKAAMAEGIKWTSSGPFRLDNHARSLTTGPSGAASNLDQILGKTIPAALGENPLTSAELLPLLGQLSILSPTAARVTLSTLIRQEAQSADGKIAAAKPGLKLALATDLAVSLLRMGILDPTVLSDLGEAVEEMALTVQADSLGKLFRGLAAAATADATLAPSFNFSATALNRGVQKGKKTLSSDQQSRLLQAVFDAVRAAVGGSGLLEPGSSELNEALATLVDGKTLTVTSLRRVWKEATRILSQSPSQPALADAVAASLTPQMVFLRDDVKGQLLQASLNYPQLGHAVQQNFVYAWVKAWNRMAEGGMPVSNFNRLKAGYFEPMVPKILDFPPDSIDVAFLRALGRWGLIKDEDIEKKFPRLFLAQLEKRDKAMKTFAGDESPENAMRSLATSLAVVTALYQVHLPVLNKWVRRHEE